MWQAILFLAVVAGLPVQAASLTPRATFTGEGRSCHGSLAITAPTISWMTPFSQCKAVPVQLLERRDENGHVRLTYRLKRQPRHCLYRIVMLHHESSANDDDAWSVVGYGSAETYESDKKSGYTLNAPDMIICPLTRQTQ
jgi:hypothetical protein